MERKGLTSHMQEPDYQSRTRSASTRPCLGERPGVYSSRPSTDQGKVMTDTQVNIHIEDPPLEVSLESLSAQLQQLRQDTATGMNQLGTQMNWLCENLQSLFSFINHLNQNGGGMRGLMKAMKQSNAPEMTHE
jgi:hypothetical protein